jgi:Uma2 family endonuclease
LAEEYEDYERAGVREYWIIDPQERRVEAYRLAPAGKGFRAVKAKAGRATSSVVSGFFLCDAWVFGGQLPSVLRVVRELGVEG